MSALNPKQFPWTKEHNEHTGVTYYVHSATGHKVFNTLTGRHRWQIEGSSANGEVFKSLGEAKSRIEDKHEDDQWNSMSNEQKQEKMKAKE